MNISIYFCSKHMWEEYITQHYVIFEGFVLSKNQCSLLLDDEEVIQYDYKTGLLAYIESNAVGSYTLDDYIKNFVNVGIGCGLEIVKLYDYKGSNVLSFISESNETIQKQKELYSYGVCRVHPRFKKYLVNSNVVEVKSAGYSNCTMYKLAKLSYWVMGDYVFYQDSSVKEYLNALCTMYHCLYRDEYMLESQLSGIGVFMGFYDLYISTEWVMQYEGVLG